MACTISFYIVIIATALQQGIHLEVIFYLLL